LEEREIALGIGRDDLDRQAFLAVADAHLAALRDDVVVGDERAAARDIESRAGAVEARSARVLFRRATAVAALGLADHGFFRLERRRELGGFSQILLVELRRKARQRGGILFRGPVLGIAQRDGVPEICFLVIDLDADAAFVKARETP